MHFNLKSILWLGECACVGHVTLADVICSVTPLSCAARPARIVPAARPAFLLSREYSFLSFLATRVVLRGAHTFLCNFEVEIASISLTFNLISISNGEQTQTAENTLSKKRCQVHDMKSNKISGYSFTFRRRLGDLQNYVRRL